MHGGRPWSALLSPHSCGERSPKRLLKGLALHKNSIGGTRVTRVTALHPPGPGLPCRPPSSGQETPGSWRRRTIRGASSSRRPHKGPDRQRTQRCLQEIARRCQRDPHRRRRRTSLPASATNCRRLMTARGTSGLGRTARSRSTRRGGGCRIREDPGVRCFMPEPNTTNVIRPGKAADGAMMPPKPASEAAWATAWLCV